MEPKLDEPSAAEEKSGVVAEGGERVAALQEKKRVQFQFSEEEKLPNVYDTPTAENTEDIVSLSIANSPAENVNETPKWFDKVLTQGQKILDSKIFFFLLVIANVYVIFVNPLYPIVFWKSADTPFDVFCILFIVFFSFELALQLVCVRGYFLSFYFFIDCLSTILLVFDLSFVYYSVFYSQDEGSSFFAAIKILKVVRVLRLVRILKLVYTYSEIRGKKVGPQQAKSKSEAQITKMLKESNLRKLIVLILVVLIAIPFFDISTYVDTAQVGLEYKARFIVPRFLARYSTFDGNIYELKGLFAENAIEMIYLRINEQVWDDDVFDYLRPNEWNRAVLAFQFGAITYDVNLVTNVRYQSQLTNMLLLLNSLLVTAIMAGSIYSLNKDMSNLVLNPLERMIQKVKEVSRDPLQALRSRADPQQKKTETNETLFIEMAINKISQLLVLGFGQAGCKIITYYLVGESADLDEKIPGVRVRAIFGFCDIRQFTDATEVLLGEVTAFVNSIAEIVHHAVDSFGGAANKNIGDAFLLVWKLHQEEQPAETLKELLQADEQLTPAMLVQRAQELNALNAEMALLSFVKVVININTLPSVTHYAQNAQLRARMPGYRVRMGFGLHEGWAIEGAIGSRYKIDASYLSPNVNLASRLEAATKQFGVEILVSGSVFRLFRTPRLRSLCRHIDTVTVKGSLRPIKLYTVDLNVPALEDEEVLAYARSELSAVQIDKRGNLREKYKRLSKRIISNDFKLEDARVLTRAKTVEEESQTLRTLHRPDFAAVLAFDGLDMPTFRLLFKGAVESYLEGQWPKARGYFERCLKIKPGDGPSAVVLEFMREAGFEAPAQWKNCRELLDK